MNTPPLSLTGPLSVHRLSGRVALITGGASKTGVETARRVLREGANVFLVDTDSMALNFALNSLKDLLVTGQSISSRIYTMVADVTCEADVEMVMKRVVSTFGKLDCAFVNSSLAAGGKRREKSLFETSEGEYEDVMRENVKSAFLGLKHAATTMRNLGNGGSIILASSIAGLHGTPGQMLNSASQFAIRGLTLTAATELGQYKIRVNAIHPSDFEVSSEEGASGVQTPLGRLAQVDDVASVVAFLASEDSKFMTGGSLKIDGGCVSS
ncbi:hypothetical protein BCR34DRAFT_494265 [Clohesyomyces aquaticus]|uniref:NAD(P)-binding protein n=1 Tax=Clohesyomyces aquaticus TaxID=1231657 RepID=A0A1Y1YSE7_9PLEO|nr:hypothetical protein BCR34DRAFT_494265 [Clohesyomyces aquaticus]